MTADNAEDGQLEEGEEEGGQQAQKTQGKKGKKKKKKLRHRNTLSKELKKVAPGQGHGDKAANDGGYAFSISNAPANVYVDEGDLPPWFPTRFAPAAAVRDDIDTSITRQVKLGVDPTFPVSKSISEAPRSFRVPRASYFANTWVQGFDPKLTREELAAQRQQRISRSALTLAQIWPYLTRRIEANEMSEENGLTGELWRSIFRRRGLGRDLRNVLEKTGLNVMLETDPAPTSGKPDNINTPYATLKPTRADLTRRPHEDDSLVCDAESGLFCGSFFKAIPRALDDDEEPLREEGLRVLKVPQDWDTCQKTEWFLHTSGFDRSFRPVQSLDSDSGVTREWVRWIDYDNRRIIWLPPTSKGFAVLGGERAPSEDIPLETDVDGEWVRDPEQPFTMRMWPGLW